MQLPTPNPDTIVIERITPLLDCGHYPLKRNVGEDLIVEADIFKDGHDLVSAVMKWRLEGTTKWNETAMVAMENDRWRGIFPLLETGYYEYTIESWADAFRSWCQEYRKKYDGGIRELSSEQLEGARLLAEAANRATDKEDRKELKKFSKKLSQESADTVRTLIENPDVIALMAQWPDRTQSTHYKPLLRVRVDRERAAYAAWYEFFPRSAEGKANVGSTFRSCIDRIQDAKAMGFDVIYFPPIHPIGLTNRKGKNNALECEATDPGVPYAIGNYRQGINGGGHKDVAPELGTLEDFDWLVGEIHKHGMEIALDFAINCSPDHPYVREHPEWFFKRPDGTIKYAENPPKKYEDVYPLNFHNPNWWELWQEMLSIILFWCKHKVRIFRVDNPHTKPVAFWEWLIAEVQKQFPDTIFLSEAFTRPKMMRILAKAGFTQSYTYFTWRNTKEEITEYFTELTRTEMREYFRPHLFTNTPDILPYFLQQGGRSAFVIRALLAATLSPLYGIYSGFELCENQAIPGKEEYINSEKYQFKERDWNAPGNIKSLLTNLNKIRRANRSLHSFTNLHFHICENDQILCYSKTTPAKDNLLIIIISLDPFHPQSGFITIPMKHFGFMESDTYQVEDLLTNECFQWTGPRNYVALDPYTRPAHILRVSRWTGRERAYDYFQ